MAAVKNIVDGDQHALTWLEILDTEGKQWKYHQSGPAPAQATIHVYQHDDGVVEIMPDGAGGALCRQEGPGLPPSINVRLAPTPSPGPGSGVVAGWGGGIFVYEQR
jgi:hypothetical protein